MSEQKKSEALLALGMAKKAGKVICGTPPVCKALCAKAPPTLAVMSIHASDNTKKRLRDKCAFYGVHLYELDVSTEQLARALGSNAQTAAAAICDEGLTRLFLAKAENDIKRNEE